MYIRSKEKILGNDFMKHTERITINPDIMGGVPCIRNLRMPVATILAMLSDGMTEEQILKQHPELEIEDFQEIFRYSSDFFRIREFPLAV